MMDGTFVKEFKGALAGPVGLTALDGKVRLFVPQGWSDLTPKPAQVTSLTMNTLTGLVEYIRSGVDSLSLSECLVQVVAPDRVELCARLEGEADEFRRKIYAVATTKMHGVGFHFGEYLDAESCVIGLQTMFLPSPSREEILMLLASIKESIVRETVDTGVAQEVKTAGGIVMVGMTRVPNPVELMPYRTFREVAQPLSRFVLRLQSRKDEEKPRCALFEADGGVWRIEAILSVTQYLREHLADLVQVIG